MTAKLDRAAVDHARQPVAEGKYVLGDSRARSEQRPTAAEKTD
jgi:hypothetical protein